MLEPLEFKRYSRQIILPEIGLQGQQQLKAARVLMIGAGGLGCPVLQYLAAAGIGRLGIVDDDMIDLTNLHRQILYSTADIGLNKAETARDKLKLLNPFVDVVAYAERITPTNAATLISGYDIIVDGSDNFFTRYLVNDTCIALKKTLVSGAIFKYEGQVAVFNYQGGPSYRDLFPDENNADTDNCAEAGVLGVLPGIIGSYMANEVIKIVCKIGDVLSGKLLTVNALDCSTYIFGIPKAAATADTAATAGVAGASTASGAAAADGASNAAAPAGVAGASTASGAAAADGASTAAAPAGVAGASAVGAHLTAEVFSAPELAKAVSVTGEILKPELTFKEYEQYLLQKNEGLLLIDVRENYEFEEGNIGGINIPVYELLAHLNEFEDSKTLVFYCQSGQRSKLAVQLLKPIYHGSMFILK